MHSPGIKKYVCVVVVVLLLLCFFFFVCFFFVFFFLGGGLFGWLVVVCLFLSLFCCLFSHRHMGSHMPPSEDLSPFMQGGSCYARSLPWLKAVPHLNMQCITTF